MGCPRLGQRPRRGRRAGPGLAGGAGFPPDLVLAVWAAAARTLLPAPRPAN